MMMMSIFSSFDALSAELFGQKLGLSWVPFSAKEQKELRAPASGGSDKAASPAPAFDKKPRQEQRRPRFAVELDGIHCFETIIPN
nr:AF211539_1 Avr9/Cf-9 rapidly elicited protein 65 [Ipomoea batatas]